MRSFQTRTAISGHERLVPIGSLVELLIVGGFFLCVMAVVTPSQGAMTQHNQASRIDAVSLKEMGREARQFAEVQEAITRADYDQAHLTLRLLAEAGNTDSYYELGVLYYTGLGVGKDVREAMRWNRLAAEQGHVDAQKNMGIAYAMGIGVPTDAAEAAKWYRKAALQGNTDAQFNLGLLYAQGQGITKNMSEAAKWWFQAATHGHAAAQFAVGLMFVRGEGVSQDFNEAAKWWYLSANQGFEPARDALQKLMTLVISQ